MQLGAERVVAFFGGGPVLILCLGQELDPVLLVEKRILFLTRC